MDIHHFATKLFINSFLENGSLILFCCKTPCPLVNYSLEYTDYWYTLKNLLSGHKGQLKSTTIKV